MGLTHGRSASYAWLVARVLLRVRAFVLHCAATALTVPRETRLPLCLRFHLLLCFCFQLPNLGGTPELETKTEPRHTFHVKQRREAGRPRNEIRDGGVRVPFCIMVRGSSGEYNGSSSGRVPRPLVRLKFFGILGPFSHVNGIPLRVFSGPLSCVIVGYGRFCIQIWRYQRRRA